MRDPGSGCEKVDESDDLPGVAETGWRSLPQAEPKASNNGHANGSDTRRGRRGHRARGPFHSTRFFMVVFLTGWVMQGVFYTSFVSSITSIEKLFRIESKTTGTLLAATEIGQICTSLFLTYFAGRGNRPRWIGSGMLLFSLGVLGCALPHVLYGTQLLRATNALHLQAGVDLGANSSLALDPTCPAERQSNSCAPAMLHGQAEHSLITSTVLPLFFVCLLAVGVGQTAICTLGIPYIDDNVASRQSPLYMAITIGVRVIGPSLGFVLGAFCTRLYVEPSVDPGFGPEDPRWVGAWWLGLILVSATMFAMSVLMFCFPRQIRSTPGATSLTPNRRPTNKNSPLSHFKEFPAAIKRQLTNDILMFRMASSVLHLVPITGLYSFLPKYMETQFRLAAHEANLISGLGGILVMGIGILVSGVVILKCVPTARTVAAWTAATAVIYSTGMVILMFVGCPMENLLGLPADSLVNGHTSVKPFDTPTNPTEIVTDFKMWCEPDCFCDTKKYSPVCGEDGLAYFSPCHAGCRNTNVVNKKVENYLNCECINQTNIDTIDDRFMQNGYTNKRNNWGTAKDGFCHGTCNNIYIFVVIFSFIMFIHASGEVGSILLIMRCTDPKDKALAMGVIQFAIGLFGNVPCPVVFGAVIDGACRAWDSICGSRGACMLYDTDLFRRVFLGLSAGIMFLAFIMDIVVWSKAGRIEFNPEQNSAPPTNKENGTAAAIPHDSSTAPLTVPAVDTQV